MDMAYWRTAVSSLARNVRRTPGFTAELLRLGLTADNRAKAPGVYLLNAFPEAEQLAVQMGEVTYRRSNLDPLEQYVLGVIARLREPKRIFEIGTYDGASTLLLARNSPDAEIFTLDLPPEAASSATEKHEAENARRGVGAKFAGTSEAARITQLFGDSRNFDCSRWFGTVDLVVVDGGHEYDCVAADTQNALRLLAPDGIVVWDDYIQGWPDVIRAVDEAGVPAVHIDGTGFAIYDSRRA